MFTHIPASGKVVGDDFFLNGPTREKSDFFIRTLAEFLQFLKNRKVSKKMYPSLYIVVGQVNSTLRPEYLCQK